MIALKEKQELQPRAQSNPQQPKKQNKVNYISQQACGPLHTKKVVQHSTWQLYEPIKLVHMYYNMRLKVQNLFKRQQDVAYYNAIELNHIFVVDDILDSWIHKEPVLDG